MSNILSEMKNSLVRYAEIISNITDSVVSIIDSDMIRLLYVGGGWKNDIGESCAKVGHIAEAALETGQSQIMLEAAGRIYALWRLCTLEIMPEGWIRPSAPLTMNFGI